MQKDDAIRLRHMLDAAREAFEFIRGQKRARLDITKTPAASSKI